MQDELRLLSLMQVAKLLGISDKTVRRLVREGNMPAVLVGKRYRVPLSALQRWMEEQIARKKEG